MRKINYYQPLVNAVAKNGSERLGVTVETQIWESDKPRRKMHLSVNGKSKEEAIQKFYNSLKSEDTEVTELPCAYFFCSESVIGHFKPFEVSKPFKSGYDWDKDNYYIAWLNFEECEKFYKEVLKEETDFFLWEFCPGTMDVSNISMRSAKNSGLLSEIEEKIGLTVERNIAMTIHNLSQKHNCTPVELINKYL
jgi:hypothetical protein